MKLRFTTKSFVFSCVLFVIFRILQIILLTESGTAFLKPDYLWQNVVGTVLCLILVAYTVANAFYAYREPMVIGKTGLCGMIISAVTGGTFLVSALISVVSQTFSIASAVFTLLGVAGCVLFALHEASILSLPEPTALLLLAMWFYNFIKAYIVYTSHPLRVRTVYEIIAMILAIFFFLGFAKAHSGVETSKNFRFLYPLGFAAAIFCFVATVPEIVAVALKFSENVTDSYTSYISLLGTGIFITYLTISTNAYSNTHKK